MTQKSTEGAVAGLVAAMVQPYDTGDVLADLVQDCAALYPAAAVAVMVIDGDRGLEMLSATSHRAEAWNSFRSSTSAVPVWTRPGTRPSSRPRGRRWRPGGGRSAMPSRQRVSRVYTPTPCGGVAKPWVASTCSSTRRESRVPRSR